MKKLLFIMMTLSFLLGSHAQNKVDFKKEKAAIRATIEGEKRGYVEKNMELMKKNVINEPAYSWIFADNNSYIFSHGFSTHEKRIKNWWENSDTNEKITSEFIELKIYDETAWAVIEVVWSQMENGKIVEQNNGIETLFFEKDNGKWKIACHAAINTSSYE